MESQIAGLLDSQRRLETVVLDIWNDHRKQARCIRRLEHLVCKLTGTESSADAVDRITAGILGARVRQYVARRHAATAVQRYWRARVDQEKQRVATAVGRIQRSWRASQWRRAHAQWTALRRENARLRSAVVLQAAARCMIHARRADRGRAVVAAVARADRWPGVARRLSAVVGAARSIQLAYRRHAHDRPAKLRRLWQRMSIVAAEAGVCPITFAPIGDPLLCLVDMQTYEAAAIRKWVAQSGTSPVTREIVRPHHLVRPSRFKTWLAAVQADDYMRGHDRELFDAAGTGNVATVERLLTHGICSLDRTHDFRRTPLHNAARNGHAPVVRLLIAAGCEVDSVTNGWTPLLNAAYHQHFHVVQVLIEARADQQRSVDGRSVVDWAKRQGGTYDQLLAAGLDVPDGLFN
jgi:hypothetical protein